MLRDRRPDLWAREIVAAFDTSSKITPGMRAALVAAVNDLAQSWRDLDAAHACRCAAQLDHAHQQDLDEIRALFVDVRQAVDHLDRRLSESEQIRRLVAVND